MRQANGVKDIVEVKIGYDGIVLANSKKAAPLKLTRKDLFLALAKDVPDPSGRQKLVPNPYKTWKDINAACRPPKSKYWDRLPPPVPGMLSWNSLWKTGPRNSLLKALDKKELQSGRPYHPRRRCLYRSR